MYGNNYPEPAETKCVEARRYTLTERLTQEKTNLESRLEEINAVLNVLGQNPQVQSVLDLLQKTRCL